MNREFRIVMSEEAAEHLALVLNDSLEDGIALGGGWYGTEFIEDVVRQLTIEHKRLFPVETNA